MASMQFYLHCFTLQETNINKSLQYKSVIWFCLLCHVSRFFDLMYIYSTWSTSSQLIYQYMVFFRRRIAMGKLWVWSGMPTCLWPPVTKETHCFSISASIAIKQLYIIMVGIQCSSVKIHKLPPKTSNIKGFLTRYDC